VNIIAASVLALIDSLEFGLWKGGAELRRRDERHFTSPVAAGTRPAVGSSADGDADLAGSAA
jgi:hypothetical protein